MENDDDTNSDKRLITTGLKTIGTALIISYITASTTWMFIQSANLARIEAILEANTVRIQSLESGRTTPMAAETRAELNAIWRVLEQKGYTTPSTSKSPRESRMSQ